MIFRELSNAVFRFVLRCAGAEIDGGVFKHPPPPPSRSWKIQRPSRARVKYDQEQTPNNVGEIPILNPYAERIAVIGFSTSRHVLPDSGVNENVS